MNNLRQHILRYLFLFVGAIAISSCQNFEDNEKDLDKGYITFSLSADSATNTKSDDETDVEVPSTEINIYDSSTDELVATLYYPEMGDEPIEFTEGFYHITAHTTTTLENAVFDTPSYAWEGDIEIKPFIENQIDIEMTLSVVKVTVSFSDNLLQNIGDNEYKTTITNSDGESLIFTKGEDRVGYIAPAEGTLTYFFEVTLSNDKTYAISSSVNVAAADYLNLTFDLEEQIENLENTKVDITIDQTLNEEQQTISIYLIEVAPPTIESSAFDENSTVEVKSGYALEMEYSFTISSEIGLSRVYFNGDKETLEELGITRLQDILNMDASTSQKFSDAGIAIEVVESDTDLGTTKLKINFDDLVKTLSPGDLGETTYPFYIVAVDRYNYTTERQFAFSIIGKRIYINDLYSISQANVTNTPDLCMEGVWTSSSKPDNISFQYRKVGDSDWTTVPESSITLYEQEKIYIGRVSAESGVNYECRVIELSDDWITVEDVGETTLEHTLSENNLNMEKVYTVPKGTDSSTDINLRMVSSWGGDTKPENISFQYRFKGSAKWSIAPLSSVTSITDDKSLESSIDIDGDLEFECRAIELSDNGTVTSYGDFVLEYDSYDNINVPNLSFDDWHSDGDTYYPNASGGNSYWASGNEGVTMWPISKSSNCAPESSNVISGKAAKLFTYTGITVVDVAAGSIYTGTYSTNITDPSSSVSFGRSFTGRPAALQGYFRYSSGGNVNGSPDKCHIYLKLEGANGEVGYGEMMTDRTVSSYEKFYFDITYTSSDPVTTITLVATSSYLGGNFEGAANSTLYVDEFELVY